MPGPLAQPHKPSSRSAGKRNLLVLPAECTLPLPPLPSGRDWSKDERALWRTLWKSPQASQWDDSFGPSVAMYVVNTLTILSGQGAAWTAQEARHLGDKLGLTPAGMQALGWQLEDAVPAPAPAPRLVSSLERARARAAGDEA